MPLALVVAFAVLPRQAPLCGRPAPHCALVSPLVEMPRRFLTLPQDVWLGPGWEVVSATAPREGADGRDTPLSLMLDSGLTTSMLAPPVVGHLGLDLSSQQLGGDGAARSPTFFAADGSRDAQRVFLPNVRCGGLDLGTFSSLVTDFPQRDIGAELGWTIDGMLGMEFYERYGVETGSDCLRLYGPDDGRCVAEDKHMEPLTLTPLPARLLGVEVLSGNGGGPRRPRALGILDTGAAHTVLNWAAAAALLGIAEDDPSLADAGGITASDIGGQPIDMPIVVAELCLKGAGHPPSGSVRLRPVEVALGNIALFARLLGDESEPAVLVGQDLLTQRPTLFAAQQRLLCFGAV